MLDFVPFTCAQRADGKHGSLLGKIVGAQLRNDRAQIVQRCESCNPVIFLQTLKRSVDLSACLGLRNLLICILQHLIVEADLQHSFTYGVDEIPTDLLCDPAAGPFFLFAPANFVQICSVWRRRRRVLSQQIKHSALQDQRSSPTPRQMRPAMTRQGLRRPGPSMRGCQ